MMKTCTHCSEAKPESEFNRGGGGDGLNSWCKTCTRAKDRAWAREHANDPPEDPDETRDKEESLFDICGICLEKTTALVRDHNHDTRELRGVICATCNSGLGMLGDDPETVRRALQYLETAEHRRRVFLMLED